VASLCFYINWRKRSKGICIEKQNKTKQQLPEENTHKQSLDYSVISMPLRHDRATPSIISSSSTRRSPHRHSDRYGRTSGDSLVNGHGRTSGGSFFTTGEYPHSHTHHTHSHSGSPVYGTSPSHMQAKPNLMDRLAHGPATRPAPQHQQSFGADTTAATCEGPTSHVPPSQRGFAAPPPQPVIHRTQHVPTTGDRFHGE